MTCLKNLLNKVSSVAGIIGVSLFLLLLGISMVHAQPSPEQLLQQAKEMKMQAAKARCENIGQETAICYTGNKAHCDELQKSLASFAKDFGYTPEMSCPDLSFLVSGSVK